jgi:hypothetical protein
MSEARLAFQKRDGDIAVEVWEWAEDGHTKRRIDLLRSYEENGEWKTTKRLGFAGERKGVPLLKEARDWINQRDKEEGHARETRQQPTEGWTLGMRYDARIRHQAAMNRARGR